MNQGGGPSILAGRAIYSSLEALVWRGVFEAEAAALLPAHVESQAEAESLFRSLGLGGSYLAPIGSGPDADETRIAALVQRARADFERLQGRAARAGLVSLCAELERAARRRRRQRRPGLALVGLMAAGKTETGRHLAKLLRLPFKDSDAWIETEAGSSVAEIFAAEGEEGFRRREERALAEIAASGPSVLACGGGVVQSVANRALLARAFTTIWLHVEPLTAVARLSAEPGGPGLRPLLAGGETAAVLRRLMAERLPLYAAGADLLLSTEGRPAAQVAGLIHAEIGDAR